MYMLSLGEGMDMAFPDVCKTPPLAIPIPYPDMSFSATSSPMATNILVECTPALHQMSEGLVSVGDDAGVMLGLVSEDISGETAYEVGCFTIFNEGIPAQRLTSVTGQNAIGLLPNAPGICICPSQTTVLALG